MPQHDVWSSDPTRPLILTPGEPAGIGAEIAGLAWMRQSSESIPCFVLLDEVERLHALFAELGWRIPVAEVTSCADAIDAFAEALPVLDHRFGRKVVPGTPSSATGEAVLNAIRRAVALVRSVEAAAVVTNPIAKSVLYDAGFAHPGHTEFLAALAADDALPAPTPVMMLACPELRVVPVTIHIPLRQVPEALTRDAILHAARVTARSLIRDFGIANPRLCVAGLNPHAGEQGVLGREDIDVIAPALETLRAEGFSVTGPVSADTMFHAAARAAYDAALCTYHDQALIPIKTIDFARGVNITLGLPFVRTSPDHGTAFALAGTGKADPTSLIEALRTAREMVEGRARAAAADGV